MIAAWMLTASLFALFAALAALCAEQVARALGRAARWGWAAALAASVLWPMALLVMRHDAPVAGVVPLPPIRVTQLVSPALERSSGAWLPALDRGLVAAWLLASVVLLARVAIGLLRVRALRRVAERQRVSGVPVLVSESVGPAVVGLLHTEIVYPRALLSLEPALREVIIRHEDEHRRAGDAWLAFGAALAVVVMPWSGALWWMARRARLALEMDCDARVLREHGDPVQYGKLLLLVAQGGSTGAFVPALISSRTHLERRIHAMLSQHPTHRVIRVAIGTAGLLVASVAAASAHVTSAAGVRPAPRAASDTGEAPRKASGDTYFEFQVEKQVRQLSPIAHLHYPPEMKAAGQDGEVLAQFVVDTSGRPVPGTFKVLRSTNVAFTDAVRATLDSLRFTPAEIGGRKVKQLVQQPFTFTLAKP